MSRILISRLGIVPRVEGWLSWRLFKPSKNSLEKDDDFLSICKYPKKTNQPQKKKKSVGEVLQSLRGGPFCVKGLCKYTEMSTLVNLCADQQCLSI